MVWRAGVILTLLFPASCDKAADPALAARQRSIAAPVTPESFALHMADCSAVNQMRRSDPAITELRRQCAAKAVDLIALSSTCIDACRAAAFADRGSPRWPAAQATVTALCGSKPCSP